jgi:predicted N-acyltransferase
VAFSVKIAQSLKAVPSDAWDSCALTHEDGITSLNPFASHAFLSSLEDSTCVSGQKGWLPLHVTVEDEKGAMLGAAPLYLKSHSMGEYVFDHAWADAFERAGGRYYPKLQAAIPFTPASSPKLLVPEGPRADSVRAHLIGGMEAVREQTSASSIHATFLAEQDIRSFTSAGFLLRNDQQFHWFNEGYTSFDDFLAQLASRKRKAIKRERRDALANGITVEWLQGAEITQAHWDAFFAFYMDTGSRKWGRPYLNRAFFSLIGERMADRILLIMAKRAGRYIAGAINFIGETRLFGRNWGCIEDHPFLHFEVCYYQAIDYAIAKGLKRVEAGAQGEHKLARGYRPVVTTSAHEIADPSLKRAIAEYLDQERRYVNESVVELEEAMPFRQPAAITTATK